MTVYIILALVAAQRLGELILAQRNTRALLARGGQEVGSSHYPLFVLLHALWLVTIAALLPKPPVIFWPLLGVYLVLQILRIWTVSSLGAYWTTRIITMPQAPLVRRGPYRFVRHPNYLIVIGEIAVLPLVFGEVAVAIVFSILNAALLTWRIRAENAALAPRRAL
ncbi:MAG TPA: isoprenylcysteine carboxylmethyltransferase family protein [Rhizomicrobium sp.]|nr:isoprenylcysteine carboxylmethyltransferase family protein [Rhizomicrobium sp.]